MQRLGLSGKKRDQSTILPNSSLLFSNSPISSPWEKIIADFWLVSCMTFSKIGKICTSCSRGRLGAFTSGILAGVWG